MYIFITPPLNFEPFFLTSFFPLCLVTVTSYDLSETRKASSYFMESQRNKNKHPQSPNSVLFPSSRRIYTQEPA